MRSAVHGGASAPELRRAHQALADATDPAAHPDRRAWHRAAAAPGLDEAVARELTAVADIARRRGRYAAEAAFLRRGAELTPDPTAQTERMLAAAQAYLTAGEPRQARALLDTVEPHLDGAAQHARAQRLRAGLRSLSRPGDVPGLLLDAARMLAPLDPQAGREICGEAVNALAISVQHTRGLTPADVAGEVLRIRGSPTDSGVELLIDGTARRIFSGYLDGYGSLRRATELLASETASLGGLDRWVGMLNGLIWELWDDATVPALVGRIEAAQRVNGALDTLPVTLEGLAHIELSRGRLAEADAYHSEATDLAVALGGHPAACGAPQGRAARLAR